MTANRPQRHMRKITAAISLVLVGLILLWQCSPAVAKRRKKAADELAPDTFPPTVEDVDLGETWFGPVVENGDLSGQVVLIYKWNTKSAGAARALPYFSRLSKKYRHSGLVVSAVVGGADNKAVTIAVAMAKGVNFNISTRGRHFGHLTGKWPVFLFGHDGKLVYEGPLGKRLAQAVKSAVEKRPNPLLGQRQYEHLSGAVASIEAGKLAQAWKECESKKTQEGKAGEEASFLLKKLDEYAEALLEKAEKRKDESPSETIEILKELSRSFAAAPGGDKAKARLAELSKDEDFQNAIKAEKEYMKIVRVIAGIPPYPKDRNKQRLWRRKHGGKVVALRAKLARMRRDYPSAYAVQLVEDLVGGLLPSY